MRSKRTFFFFGIAVAFLLLALIALGPAAFHVNLHEGLGSSIFYAFFAGVITVLIWLSALDIVDKGGSPKILLSLFSVVALGIGLGILDSASFVPASRPAVIVFDDGIEVYHNTMDLPHAILATFAGYIEYVHTGWEEHYVSTIATTKDGRKVHVTVSFSARLKDDDDILTRVVREGRKSDQLSRQVVAQSLDSIGTRALQDAITRIDLKELGENRLLAEWSLGSALKGSVLKPGDFEFGNTIQVTSMKAWLGT